MTLPLGQPRTAQLQITHTGAPITLFLNSYETISWTIDPLPPGVQLAQIVLISYDPQILNGSRRRRIATGSGTTVEDVNMLVRQFREMQKMMKQMGILGMGKGKKRRGRGGPPGGLMGMFGGPN